MEIVNTYATTPAAIDAAAIKANVCLLHVLTRDAAGDCAVYSGLVSRGTIATPAGRARAAESVAFSGTKESESTARALFAFPDWPYRR